MQSWRRRSRLRSRISPFAAAGLALLVLGLSLLAAPAEAGLDYSITFGSAARLPAGCTEIGTPPETDLECWASEDETLDFSIIIHIGTGGMAEYSFGAQWDQGLQNALTVTSATQGTQTFVEVSAGPPPVTVGYNVLGGAGATVGPGGITQSP